MLWLLFDTVAVLALAGWVWFGFKWLDGRLSALESAFSSNKS